MRQEVELYRDKLRGCGEIAAKKAFVVLMGAYAQQRLHSPKVFKDKMETLLARYPADVVNKVIERHPENYQWLNIAEVTAELEKAVEPIRRRLQDARDRLRQEQQLEFHESPEQAAQVQKLLGELAGRLKGKRPALKTRRPLADRTYEEKRRERFEKGNAAPKSGESKNISADLQSQKTQNSQQDEPCQ